MARDWIKMRCDLRTHPKIVRVSSALKADRLRTLGALHATWSIFDAHSIDGILPGYTFETMDEEIGWKGFCKALSAAGVEWIEQTPEGLKMPRFEAHNGESAKRRAEDSERKRSERKTDKSRTELGPSPDQRREEKSSSNKHSTVTTGTAAPQPPAEHRERTSTSKPMLPARALSKTQQILEDQRVAAARAAPPPAGFMDTWKKPIDHFAAIGAKDSPTAPFNDHPAAPPATPPHHDDDFGP